MFKEQTIQAAETAVEKVKSKALETVTDVKERDRLVKKFDELKQFTKVEIANSAERMTEVFNKLNAADEDEAMALFVQRVVSTEQKISENAVNALTKIGKNAADISELERNLRTFGQMPTGDKMQDLKNGSFFGKGLRFSMTSLLMMLMLARETKYVVTSKALKGEEGLSLKRVFIDDSARLRFSVDQLWIALKPGEKRSFENKEILMFNRAGTTAVSPVMELEGFVAIANSTIVKDSEKLTYEVQNTHGATELLILVKELGQMSAGVRMQSLIMVAGTLVAASVSDLLGVLVPILSPEIMKFMNAESSGLLTSVK